ncbi:MAG TPA: HAD-IB family phosphatase [Gammaproteobacteria bacterium]|nr:HAD-IB family phosphatase [Gammaproteobacteria bacterium]
MLPPSWQLQIPLDAIIFDCDGTLSSIEGIDQLAELNDVSESVKELTSIAMSKTGLTPDIYQKRMDLILPTQKFIDALGKQYCKNLTPDSDAVIRLLHGLKKEIYIVSAGLYPAIVPLAELLNISDKNIYAVGIQFDSHGKLLSYEQDSPLTKNEGKKVIVTEILKKHSRIGYVGDGLNDVVVYDLVTRFIGYGGIYYRSNIAALCEYYIETPSMSAILPLFLTQMEYENLAEEGKNLYRKGLPV